MVHLAYIVVLVRPAGSLDAIVVTLAGLVTFLLLMVYGVRALLRGLGKICREQGRLSENMLALIVVVTLASAVITERLGQPTYETLRPSAGPGWL